MSVHSIASYVSMCSWRVCRGQGCGAGISGVIMHPKEVMLPLQEPIHAVHAGFHHSAAITNSGQVYVWGRNLCGELGLGQWSQELLPPRRIISFDGQSAIRCVTFGKRHALFSDHSGAMWASGSNRSGQLGLRMQPPARDEDTGSSTSTGSSTKSLSAVILSKHIDSKVCCFTSS